MRWSVAGFGRTNVASIGWILAAVTWSTLVAAQAGAQQPAPSDAQPGDRVETGPALAAQADGQEGVEVLAAPAEEALPKLGAPRRRLLAVVNPPRRGLGRDLARRLESVGAAHVLYSSCNPETLARDLVDLASYHAVRARLVDMFPQTHHIESVNLLRR